MADQTPQPEEHLDEREEHLDERLASAREFADEVSEHVREGKPGRAHHAFMRGWRDAVPELPLRFSVILKRLDRDVASWVQRQLRDTSQVPELQLVRETETAVHVVLAEDGRRVGDLPAQDARLLNELGADAALYRPQLLEVRSNLLGRLDHVAVELVRPEVRYCSACGNKHDGPHVNCAECRAKRRRKGEERVEPPAVHFHEALDAIVGSDERDADADAPF